MKEEDNSDLRLYYISEDETLADLMDSYLKTTKLKSKYKGLRTYFKLKPSGRVLDPKLRIADFKKAYAFGDLSIRTSGIELDFKK